MILASNRISFNPLVHRTSNIFLRPPYFTHIVLCPLDLAEYIYETESLYIAKHGGFKLLEISSIETKLCNIRQEERERKEEDEKQVKKRVENKR